MPGAIGLTFFSPPCGTVSHRVEAAQWETARSQLPSDAAGLRHGMAAYTGHRLPFSLDLIQQHEAPTPAQAAAGIPAVKNRSGLLSVEADSGQGDESTRTGITFIEAIPVAVGEENFEGVGSHEFVGVVNVEIPLQEPALLVNPVVVGDGIFEFEGDVGKDTSFRSFRELIRRPL